jgi:hypothetical protein
MPEFAITIADQATLFVVRSTPTELPHLHGIITQVPIYRRKLAIYNQKGNLLLIRCR